MNTIISNEKNPQQINDCQLQHIEESQYIARKGGVSFIDIKSKLEDIINCFSLNNEEITLRDELNDKFLELDFGSEYIINSDKIGINDAIFFVNLLNQNNSIDYTIENNKVSLDCNQKQINPTSSLLNILQVSYETKKPIRLDFDNDITVIIKLDKDGKIQAHFIPGTSEVENYLKQNIPSLKQVFEDENINYSHLGYSKHKDENNKNNSKKQKRGEN